MVVPSPSRRHLLRDAGGATLGALLGATSSNAAKPRTGTSAPHADAALAALLGGSGLDVRAFGAKFDGVSDDSAALQRAVDTAHQQRQPLLLPGGVAILNLPLDLRGRNVTIIGAGITATLLRAGRRLPVLIDVEETTDRIVSAFALMRLTLDGAHLVNRNMAIRYRHHSYLSEVNSISARVGFWEKDCWLARRFGCRSGDNAIGWHLVGSNHSSLWEACTITACSETHLKIGNEGSAPDGNAALLFRGCDIEFGKGHGIDIAVAANVVFDSCYIGENIGGDVIRNQGFVQLRSGTFFFGGGAGVGVRPLAGRATLNGVTINGQAGGIGTLVNLTEAEATAPAGHGKVAIVDANANLPVGGAPILRGDPLTRVPMVTFAPRLGRDWKAWASGATLNSRVNPPDLPDGRSVTCTGLTGEAPRIGLRAALTEARWRQSLPVYLVCVYSASAPVELALRSAANGTTRPIATLPASPTRATYVNVTTMLPVDGYGEVQASVQASPGASLSLQELTLADGTNVVSSSGNLRMLALAQ